MARRPNEPGAATRRGRPGIPVRTGIAVGLAAVLVAWLPACASGSGTAPDADTPGTPVEDSAAPSSASSGSAGSPAPGAPTAPAAPTGATAAPPDEVTADDDGRTISLASGQQLPLRLAGDRSWSDPVVQGGAVALSPVDYFADPGFREWMVTAQAPGEAVVSAEGTPNCADPASCPALTVRLRFVVTG